MAIPGQITIKTGADADLLAVFNAGQRPEALLSQIIRELQLLNGKKPQVPAPPAPADGLEADLLASYNAGAKTESLLAQIIRELKTMVTAKGLTPPVVAAAPVAPVVAGT